MGLDHERFVLQFPYIVAILSCYTIGCVFFAFRIPERWWHGKFDIWVWMLFTFFSVVSAVL
jgi:predicted membrane channel-forming protein YqfA (hemolysin III family)